MKQLLKIFLFQYSQLFYCPDANHLKGLYQNFKFPRVKSYYFTKKLYGNDKLSADFISYKSKLSKRTSFKMLYLNQLFNKITSSKLINNQTTIFTIL